MFMTFTEEDGPPLPPLRSLHWYRTTLYSLSLSLSLSAPHSLTCLCIIQSRTIAFPVLYYKTHTALLFYDHFLCTPPPPQLNSAMGLGREWKKILNEKFSMLASISRGYFPFCYRWQRQKKQKFSLSFTTFSYFSPFILFLVSGSDRYLGICAVRWWQRGCRRAERQY